MFVETVANGTPPNNLFFKEVTWADKGGDNSETALVMALSASGQEFVNAVPQGSTSDPAAAQGETPLGAAA
jgi:hypothetical protein